MDNKGEELIDYPHNTDSSRAVDISADMVAIRVVVLF